MNSRSARAFATTIAKRNTCGRKTIIEWMGGWVRHRVNVFHVHNRNVVKVGGGRVFCIPPSPPLKKVGRTPPACFCCLMNFGTVLARFIVTVARGMDGWLSGLQVIKYGFTHETITLISVVAVNLRAALKCVDGCGRNWAVNFSLFDRLARRHSSCYTLPSLQIWLDMGPYPPQLFCVTEASSPHFSDA